VETITFYEDPVINHQNLETTERLIRSIAGMYTQVAVPEVDSNHVWHGVDGGQILEFLADYVSHEGARKARADILRKYIAARQMDDELVEWTVVLISNKSASSRSPFTIAGLTGGLTGRKRLEDDNGYGERYAIQRLVSPKDETLDLSPEDIERALEKTREAWHKNPGRSKRTEPPTDPAGVVIRHDIRPSRRGLLLLYPLDPAFPDPPVPGEQPIIGFAISFPKSSSPAGASAIEYTVNNVYWEQEFGGLA
jgi:hypothetical protein